MEDVGVDGGAEEADVDDHHRRLLVHAHQQRQPGAGGKGGGRLRVFDVTIQSKQIDTTRRVDSREGSQMCLK